MYIIKIFINFVPLFQCYMRALFEYEPEDDTLLPCKEIGLKFSYGDILQVLNYYLINSTRRAADLKSIKLFSDCVRRL